MHVGGGCLLWGTWTFCTHGESGKVGSMYVCVCCAGYLRGQVRWFEVDWTCGLAYHWLELAYTLLSRCDADLPALCDSSSDDDYVPGSMAARRTPASRGRGPASLTDKPVSAGAMRVRHSRARAAEKETADDVAVRRKRELEPKYGVL